MQHCICAMYLSLKLNEYNDEYIKQMSDDWRTK
jgi:hypothetical protein